MDERQAQLRDREAQVGHGRCHRELEGRLRSSEVPRLADAELTQPRQTMLDDNPLTIQRAKRRRALAPTQFLEFLGHLRDGELAGRTRTAGALRVTARSDDGIIEGLESRDPAWWAVAVQWHPEELTATDEDWDRRLFAAFAAAVRDSGRD